MLFQLTLINWFSICFKLLLVLQVGSSWFKLFVLWSVFVGLVSSKLSEFVSVRSTLFHVVLYCEEVGLRSFVTLL